MFDNKKIKVRKLDEEVYMSRIIASWLNAKGEINNPYWGNTQFRKWCWDLGIDSDDIEHMIRILTNGKRELELLATEYIAKNKK